MRDQHIADPFSFVGGGSGSFGMLILVRIVTRRKAVGQTGILCVFLLGANSIIASKTLSSSELLFQGPPAAGSASPQQPVTQTAPAAATLPQSAVPPPAAAQPSGLNVVVLDPAHGGIDTGARGTGGVRESEMVLEVAAQVRRALETSGFQVVTTRQANDNPSFDDRSTIANAQRGAVFITLHISSTGLPGTVRVYVHSDLPSPSGATGLVPWDRAQAPYLALSHRLGDAIQGQLTQRFKGSPNAAQTAPIRQLRTTAAPAIAVEISSVSVENRADLDRMVPGVADAIARGVAAFRPSFVVPYPVGFTR